MPFVGWQMNESGLLSTSTVRDMSVDSMPSTERSLRNAPLTWMVGRQVREEFDHVCHHAKRERKKEAEEREETTGVGVEKKRERVRR